MLNYRSLVHDSVGLHGRLRWVPSGTAALAVFFFFSKKLGAVRVAGYRRATSKSRKTKSCITTSCKLSRSRLRHFYLQRQKVNCPRVL